MDPQEAVAFAERNLTLVRPPGKDVDLKTYTKDFFIPGRCPFLARMQVTGHTYSPSTIQAHRYNLVAYILPKFGRDMVCTILRRDVDLHLQSLRLANGTKQTASMEKKNKVLTTWRHILDQAEWDGVVQRNEAALAQTYVVTDSVPVEPFLPAEYKLFFPPEREKMLEIWGGPFWSTFFIVFAATGARPSQVAAFRWENWFPDLEGLWSCESIDATTGEIKGLKTEKKGVQAIPLLLTKRANDELKLWREITDHPGNDDFIFHWDGPSKRDTLQSATIQKRLNSAAKKAGVPNVGKGMRTPYSWRHSFATDLLNTLDKHTVQDLLGQRRGSRVTDKHYDHRTAEAKIRAIRDKAQPAIERRFE